MFEIDFSIVKEADLQITISCYSHPVAASAEVITHGTDKAQLSLISRYTEGLKKLHYLIHYLDRCRSFILISSKRISLLYYRSYFEVRQKFLIAPIILVKRHEFYKPDFDRSLFDKLNEIKKFIIIEILHDYNIDFHRLKSHFDCFIYRLKHLVCHFYLESLSKSTRSSGDELILGFNKRV